MENDYRITKLHGTFIGDNRIPDLPDSETAKILSSIKGKTEWVDLPEGGASVSPCLNLIDFSGEQPTIRTSITEEEKTNLENGLYNSVLYADLSAGEAGEFSIYFPESIISVYGEIIFSVYDVSFNEATQSISITGSSIYSLEIGEQNEDKSYPITINKAIVSSFGGGGGGAIQEIEAIKSTEADAEANQYTLSSTPTSSMFIMKVKNDDGAYSRFTMILQSLDASNQIFFGYKIVSLFDTNTCVYAYSAGNIAILTNQCYLPPEIKDGDVGKVLVAGGNGYRLEDLPSSLPTIYDSNIGDYLTVNSSKQAVWGKQLKEVPEASQDDIGKYLVVGDNQKAIWQNLPESTSTTVRRW